MNLYRDLNDLTIDLSAYEEQPLTATEKKRVQTLIAKRLHPKKRRLRYGIGASIVLALGILTVNHQTLANIPFIAGLLEEWQQERQVDWKPYKESIGVTSTTKLGDLTMNEVIMDYNKVLISATLQKAKGVTFSYQYQLQPTILINGEKVEVERRKAQSIEQNSEMFTIYNQITLAKPIEEADISMTLIYEHMLTPDWDSPTEREKLEEPWKFDLTTSQLAVQQKTIVKEIHQPVPLPNGDSFKIDSIVTTPISTTIYYSGATSDQSPDITLYDEEGQSYKWQSAYGEEDGTGEVNFPDASFVERQMFMEVSLGHEQSSERIAISKLHE